MFASLEALRGGDLLLAKEVLQHLPNSIINEYLDAIRQKYRFALLTNSTEPWNLTNREIEPGGFRPIRLEKPPFGAPGLDSGAKRNGVKRSGFAHPFRARQAELGEAS